MCVFVMNQKSTGSKICDVNIVSKKQRNTTGVEQKENEPQRQTRGPVWSFITHLSTKQVSSLLTFRFRRSSKIQAGGCGSHPGFFYRNDCSYFCSTFHPDTSYQVSSQLTFSFRRKKYTFIFIYLYNILRGYQFIYHAALMQYNILQHIYIYMYLKDMCMFTGHNRTFLSLS